MNQTEMAESAPSNRLLQKVAHSGDGGSESKNASQLLVDIIDHDGLLRSAGFGQVGSLLTLEC